MRLEEVCLGAAYKMLWEFSEDSGHHRQMFQVIMSLEQRVALKQKIVMNKYEKLQIVAI